jgi:[ribosomal protein S5]-alanine N-acetyltransferase
VYATTEMGLFWSIDPAQQGQGYATEAGRALIDHAFDQMHLKRIIATTEYDNHASQAVMRKLGMRLERNPQPTPPWLQIVGVLDHP